MGMKAFLHEVYHTVEQISQATFVSANVAAAAGDHPTPSTGPAEWTAIFGMILLFGSEDFMNQQYTPNSQTDAEAEALIQQGERTQQEQDEDEFLRWLNELKRDSR